MTFRSPAYAASLRLLIGLVLALTVCAGLHAKVLRGDVVVMKNGNRFTGE